MTSELKPMILYGDGFRPNPWKVVMILEELNLPYEHKQLDMTLVKSPPFTNLNPNGRIPALTDPNTAVPGGLTLWESGTIVEYLIETYDTTHKLSYSTFPEKYLLRQWMAFQMSGQGPYYGQLAWFRKFHGSKIESAISRYDEQVLRVMYVINKALGGEDEKGGEKTEEKDWLVADKCTYVDIAFVGWDMMLPFVFGDDWERVEKEIHEKYPRYVDWKKRVWGREAVKKSMKLREEMIAAAA